MCADFKSQDIKVGTPPFAKTVKLELVRTSSLGLQGAHCEVIIIHMIGSGYVQARHPHNMAL